MEKEKILTGYPSIDKPWLKYYSEEAINAPLPECTVYEYLWENNKNHLDDIALNYYDNKITYKSLFETIETITKSFLSIGIKQGDIVTICSVTLPEVIYSFYALNRIGAVANMVDPRTSAEGLKDYINEVNSKFLICLDAIALKFEQLFIDMPLEKIILISPSNSLPKIKKIIYNVKNKNYTSDNCKCILWGDLVHIAPKSSSNIIIAQKKYDCCVIEHTGGTTGIPKGVMLSNFNLNAVFSQIVTSPLKMERNDKFLNIMPPFIAYGMVLGIHTALCYGWESIIIPKFDLDDFASLIIKYKPAGIMGVPSYFESLIKDKKLKNQDLSFIKVMLVGGDRIKSEFEKEVNCFFQKHNCQASISKGYSMTEASASTTFTFENANKIDSSGIPMQKVVCAVFDQENEQELPYNTEGEICINSPSVMLGYYNNDNETKKVLKTHKDGSVWIHTGDLGYVDRDGCIFIKGRIKRMIIRHDGFKIFPSYLEDTILSHKDIRDCCVVGFKDRKHPQGSLPIAFFTLNSLGEQNTKNIINELKKLCITELPEYAQPIDFIELDTLPLTPIGKVDYLKLEEMAKDYV